MNGNHEIVHITESEPTGIFSKLNQYGYSKEEREDMCSYNLHDIFDVSVNRVPDIEGSLLCNETLNDDSENDEWGMNCIVRRRPLVVTEHQKRPNDKCPEGKEDSGFNSQYSSSPPEVPNHPDTLSGSEADVEDSDSEMQQNMDQTIQTLRNMNRQHVQVEDIQLALNDVNMNADGLHRNHILDSRQRTTASYMNVRELGDSVVPSSPIFGASTSGSFGNDDDAHVPYVASDDLASDGSLSDGDMRRLSYSCINSNDHVVPHIYIEE